ncbi:MAG: gamma-glutamyl-gamma-aminobutyrate hydrolase family protein [Rhodocyclales bacterium]|nr:gamma-glutamyl-gamma-aminobutyrate hydrolase family protein [Rhodocyclales bacterium]
MSARPIIAVSQRVDRVAARAETRDALDQRLAVWLLAVGGLPVPVPNGLGDRLDEWLAALGPAAVVLSGGNDIGECPERDRTETVLIDHAARAGLPLLGICRGMQMLAHHAGETLVAVTGHAGTRHGLGGVAVDAGDLPAEVNSFHNWGLAACPPGYRVLAAAPDGTPEALRHVARRWEAWMWHPEREPAFGLLELARARRLLIGEDEE